MTSTISAPGTQPTLAPLPTSPRASEQAPRWLLYVVAAGVLLGLGGVLLASRPVVAAGAILVGLAAAWSMVVAPVWMILGFVAIRPVFDLGPTYERGPNVNGVLGLMMLGAIGRWTWLHRHELVRPHASVFAAAGFAGAAVLSAGGSAAPVHSLDQSLRVVSVVAMFALADQISRRDPGFLQRVMVAIAVSAIGVVLPAIAQWLDWLPIPQVNGVDLEAIQSRPPGPYPAPTVLAAHLVFSGAVLLMLIPSLRQRVRWQRIVVPLTLLGVVSMWVMLINKSRSPAAALLGVAAVFAVVRWRWRGLVVMTMVSLAAVAAIDTSSVRLDEFGTGVNVGASSDTFQWRVEYWRDNLPRFQESPVTGIGLGRVEQLHQFALPPHSIYVQTIVELGLVGALALVVFMGFLTRDLVIAFLRARGTVLGYAVLLIGLLCGAYAFMGLFENLITQLVTSGYLALLTGAVLGSIRGVSPASDPVGGNGRAAVDAPAPYASRP